MSKGNIASLASVLLLALGAQSSAMAEGIRVKAGVAMLNYTDPASTAGNPDFKISAQVLTLGASYVFKDTGIFVDFTNRSSMGSPTWNSAEWGWPANYPAKYTDNTFTVGKMLEDGLFAFGGYQSQETTAEYNDPTPPAYLGSDKQTLSGFFVGAGKAFSLGEGWLSATGALAMMGSKFTWSDNTPASGSISKDPGLGYSLGLSYSYPINEMFDVVGEGKYQNYKPKGWKTADIVTSFGLNVVAKF